MSSSLFSGRAFVALCGVLLSVTSASVASGQSFANVPGLSFTKTFAGANPLPQTVAIASTGTNFNIVINVSTTTGGSWLQVTPGTGIYSTPAAYIVSVNPAVSLAAGTYSGQIVFAAYPSGNPSMTVPVSLIITPAGSAFFDNTSGQVAFSMVPGGNSPPSQIVQIRNGGAGTLNWSGTLSTADGGNWLNVSATAGTAPSLVTVSISPASLPGGGALAGTFVGQLSFQATGCSITIPVSVTVGANVFEQVNPISFTMPFAGANPPQQVLPIPSTGTNFNFYFAMVATGNGGSWLKINPSSGIYSTPAAVAVSVDASTLPAGTYTGEVMIFQYSSNNLWLTIPVTLTIAAPGTSFLDNLPGELSFFMTPGGGLPPQNLQIRNGGSGHLHWTGAASTADGGQWLTLSAPSGNAPSIVTASVTAQLLPGQGLIAGTYCGQLLFETADDTGTVPVCVVVGVNVFRQVNPINFTMPEAGENPLPQTLTMASTGTPFNVYIEAVSTGTGGSWLQISPGSGIYATPATYNVSVNASTLPPGTYTGEIVFFQYSSNTQALVVPVTLTVAAPGSTFFDNLPGQLTFFLVPGGNPPSQPVQVRNGGSGALSFTTSVSTGDGGSWLNASPASATAPATVTVSVTSQNLPNQGLIAGTYCGQVLLQTAGDTGTVPVCAVVGANVFEQVNPIDFNMTVGGSNPLPQVVTFASTGTAFNIYNTSVATATGGNWLKITPSSGIYSTPASVVVSVDGSTLPAGTYTGEIVFAQYSSNAMSITVPVNLTVAATNAPSYFDSLPGELNFSLKPGGSPPSQALQIRNAGSGTLHWTGSTSTADGGGWLSISPASGTAPTTVSVSVTPSKLPGIGLVAGTYCGQVAFVATGNVAAVPVCVLVGPNVFSQVNPMSFTMLAGGANPLPQVLPILSTGTAFNVYNTAVATAKGGNWLTLNTTSGIYGTPVNYSVSVNGAGLAAGTYSGEVTFFQYSSNAMSITVPVTLTVVSCGALFDQLPGQVAFSFTPSTTNPPSQTVSVRAAGWGALHWTLATSTADGGTWLSVSAKSGTAPSDVTIRVVNSALPGSGLVPGSFNGQLLFQSSGGNVSIPVTVVVGANVFSPITPLSFSMTLGGSNPPSQNFTLASTGTTFNAYTIDVASAGNWLSVSPSTGIYGTPKTITASVNASSLPAGVYAGEAVYFQYSNNAMAITVPMTLTITDPRIPATIAATGGTPQTATVKKAFAKPLQATVMDSGGNPVSGVLVTFDAPAKGASGTFACSGNTAITNAAGVATSQTFTANTKAGKYTVKATANSLTSNPSFSMTNKAGPPASITATAGTPQTATVNTAFATQLAATVQDTYGNNVSGATVTFNAPASGASGAFAGGVNTAKTDGHGIATAPVFTANTTAGAYTVTATVGAHTTSPGFALTNQAGPPAAIAATAGTPQTAKINTAFATNLGATVTDSFGNAVPAVTVTFNAPASGPSGTFAGGVNTAVTDSQGVATAPVFTANARAGGYTVTATAGTVTTNPGFMLTNRAGAPASITATGGTPQTATVNTAFAKRLSATVKDARGNPVSGVTVTFNAPTSGASGTFAGGVNTAKTNASGVASSQVFTANGTVGSYTVTATTGSFTTNPGFMLTNQAAAN